MKEMTKRIYEHLITKPKYNKLKIKLYVKKEEFDNKVIELNTERRVHNKQREVYESKIKEQEKEILELKEKIRTLKSKSRSNKNEKKS